MSMKLIWGFWVYGLPSSLWCFCPFLPPFPLNLSQNYYNKEVEWWIVLYDSSTVANFTSNNQNNNSEKLTDWACCRPSRTKFNEVQNVTKLNISTVFALFHCAMDRVHMEQTQGKYYDLGSDPYKGMPYAFWCSMLGTYSVPVKTALT